MPELFECEVCGRSLPLCERQVTNTRETFGESMSHREWKVAGGFCGNHFRHRLRLVPTHLKEGQHGENQQSKKNGRAGLARGGHESHNDNRSCTEDAQKNKFRSSSTHDTVLLAAWFTPVMSTTEMPTYSVKQLHLPLFKFHVPPVEGQVPHV